MLTGENILCLSSIDWDFNWQGHQEIMVRFARHGNQVLFVENTGVRSLRFHDLPRLRQRMRNWWRGTKGFRLEEKNLFVYSPLILPFPYSRFARWINLILLLRSLRRWMQTTGFRRPIIWTFLPTPLVRDLIRELLPDLIVYYCIADFEQLSFKPRKISKSERLLIDRSDIVFVQGDRLRQHCIPHPSIHTFPFGVNMELFGSLTDPAPELRLFKAPIIGYVGGIHRHVDLELIERIALEVGGTVVLVGPVQTDVGRLRQLGNVVFFGQQPHHRVAEFIRGFDIGLIPYLLNEYTRTVYPTKLNEYLAMGIPVVATDLPEIRRFNTEHGGLVTVARDADEFVQDLRNPIGNTTSMEIERRIEAARQNSWEVRIGQMSNLIEDKLSTNREAGESWEESLNRLYRTARRRIAQTVSGIIIVYILVFYTPFIWIIAKPLLVVDQPVSVDAIVVFAGGVGESGKAGGGYQERVKKSADLYHAGNAVSLIFSSGYIFAVQEAEIMKTLAVSLGVPKGAIILEKQARNTYENVRFVKEILDKKQWSKILMVSSPYHMRRALLTWHKVAPDVTIVSTPVPHSQFYAHGRGASLEQIRGILQEYAAIAVYWWKGWI